MVKATDFIWMDGELVPWGEAKVHVLTHTLHYGLGSFEGIRAYETGPGHGAVFRLPEHARRLVEGARIANLDISFTPEEVSAAILETLGANRLVEGYVRPLVYVGTGEMGVLAFKNPVHLCIATWPWGAYLGEEGKRRGIRCCVSSFTRLSPRGFLPKGKIPGHYVNSILAKEEAVRHGYAEALMMDPEGHVVEGTGENLFVVQGGHILTPPLEANILGGITRDTVLTLAAELGIEVSERLFGRDTLYLADEVFLTGTAAEVTPVREIDGRTIGAGQAGPITTRLQARYDAVVRGRDGDHPDWRTPFVVTERP